MSTLVLKEVTQKGRLSNGSWLAGIVVRVRSRAAGGAANAGKSNKGKGRKQGKPVNQNQSEGIEIHLCGGTTPADVMMVEAWAPQAVSRLKGLSKLGKALKLTDVEPFQHTDKTTPWSTSRLPLYARLLPDSRVEELEPLPEWLAYHPLTPVKSLQHVPEGRLVCVAAR